MVVLNRNVMAVAIVFNSLAIEPQRSHKLDACIVKVYENDGTLSVAFFIHIPLDTQNVKFVYNLIAYSGS